MRRWRIVGIGLALLLAAGDARAQQAASRSPVFDLLDRTLVTPAELRALLARGAPLEAPGGPQRVTPLLKAIDRAGGPMHDNSDLALVRILIAAGARVDPSAGGDAPLCLAIQGRRAEDIVILLLRAGADPNVTCNGDTPLDRAVLYHSVDIAAMLLEAGARLPSIAGKINASPLLTKATRDGAARMVALLLRHGAAVDERGVGGSTALMEARTVDAAKVLIAHRADVHARDGSGRSVLAIHVAERHDRIAALLRSHGAREESSPLPPAGAPPRQ